MIGIIIAYLEIHKSEWYKNIAAGNNEAAAKETEVGSEGEREHTQPATGGYDRGSDSANSLQPATSE